MRGPREDRRGGNLGHLSPLGESECGGRGSGGHDRCEIITSTRRDRPFGCITVHACPTYRYIIELLASAHLPAFRNSIAMSALRMQLTRARAPLSRFLSTSSALLQAEKSALEVRLRDGLKTAMKSKDKPALACLKVRQHELLLFGLRLTRRQSSRMSPITRNHPPTRTTRCPSRRSCRPSARASRTV